MVYLIGILLCVVNVITIESHIIGEHEHKEYEASAMAIC